MVDRVKVRDISVVDRYVLLLQSYKAKPFREENKSYNSLVESYDSQMKGKTYPALQWFFTNACKAMKIGYSSMMIKLSDSYWSGNVAGIGARKVKDVVDFFEDQGYIEVLVGSYDYRSEWKSYPTIVRFKEKLYDLVDMQDLRLYIPDERLVFPIVLKDREDKNHIGFDVDERVNKMEKELNDYNDSFKDVLIEFNGEPIPALEYKRSFSGNLYQGGRLFAHGGSVQLLPEHYRLKYLTLDKEPVVEVDYKSIHPNMMYEALAQQKNSVYKLAVKGFDPYAADSSFIEVDEVAIAKHKMKFGINKYDPVRKLYKRSLLMAINCKDVTETRNAISQDIFKDKRRPDEDRDYIGLGNPDLGKVLEALSEHNYLIEDHFYKDYGVKLQYVDSQIALRVIELLLQEGQTCLAYHDSFAVKSSVQPLLEAAMMQAWKDVMGENKFCFLDVK